MTGVKFVAIAAAALAIAASGWFMAIGGHAYLYAMYLESKWRKADPKTKTDLEKILHGYSLREIQPGDSEWGNAHQLKKGERMMQYRILWHKNCPLDVVYDQNDWIIAIYTSYE